MTNHLTEAADWLNLLRSGTDQYKIAICNLQQELEAGGLTPEDIGTSEAEIEDLRIKGHKMAAIKWLNSQRTTRGRANQLMNKYLRQELEAGGLTPEDIGTSEAEIEDLRIKGHKMAAVSKLQCLREGTGQSMILIHRLRQELEAGGLTLEDIGTSEAEINSFRQVA